MAFKRRLGPSIHFAYIDACTMKARDWHASVPRRPCVQAQVGFAIPEKWHVLISCNTWMVLITFFLDISPRHNLSNPFSAGEISTFFFSAVWLRLADQHHQYFNELRRLDRNTQINMTHCNGTPAVTFNRTLC
jgi:hypothetical protein